MPANSLGARPGRLTGPGLDGILVVAKSAGPTSHDVVATIRRLAATRRVGHGGTLDPFASGVLPIFLGRATRVVEYHLTDRKRYTATVCFGATSTTDDLEGQLTPTSAPAPDRAAVEAALAGFRGPIRQTPPAFSAIKVGGRRAYAMARAGATVVMPERMVTIDTLDLADWNDADPARPIAVVEVRCSAGTYVRAIARDLGASLGSGAYLGALVRTASGPFELSDAVTLDAIRLAAATEPAGVRRLLRPIDAGLDGLAAISLEPDEVAAVARGQHIRPAARIPVSPDDGGPIRLLDGSGRLVAIGVRVGNRIQPDKVLVDPPASDPG